MDGQPLTNICQTNSPPTPMTRREFTGPREKPIKRSVVVPVLTRKEAARPLHSMRLLPEEYWSDQRKNYCAKQIGEMLSWISEIKKRSNPDWCVSPKVIHVKTLNELQYLAFKIVKDHFTISNENLNGKPLFLLIKGIAGSGKSYVIDALRNLLQSKCRVLAYTGKAAFNVAYLIIDEYSFVGQNLFGWIDSRCRQASGKADEPFGGFSIIFFGDIAQLPPVGDKPLYHSVPKSEKQIKGLLMYHEFRTVITLTANERVKGSSQEQSNFRELLSRARDGNSTQDDWHTLLSRSPNNIKKHY